ncbi:MAG: type II secretion system F family protein [Pirellulaceae bacterium]
MPNVSSSIARRLPSILPMFSAQHGWRASTWWLPDSRNVVGQSLVRLLALAHRERIPVAPLVTAYALEQRYFHRKRLQQWCSLLNEGAALIPSLEQHREILPDEDILLLRLASESGMLDEAYDQLIRKYESEATAPKLQLQKVLAYVTATGVTTVILVLFLFIFIAPTYREIYDEFGLALPAAFESVSAVAKWLGSSAFLPVIAGVSLVALLVVWVFQPQRPAQRAFGSGLSRSLYQLRSAQLMRLIAMALERGRPLPGSLSTLAKYHFDRVIRGRLLFARNEVEHGASIWNSLASAQLLEQREASALDEASTNEFRSWLLRALADQKQSRIRFRYLLLSKTVYPAIILLFGCIVAWIAVGFFSVITQIITSLS